MEKDNIFWQSRSDKGILNLLVQFVNRAKYLRLYAIRIEPNMYVITGDAIKLPLQHMMDDVKSHHIQKKN